jgi:hypothetical protein
MVDPCPLLGLDMNMQHKGPIMNVMVIPMSPQEVRGQPCNPADGGALTLNRDVFRTPWGSETLLLIFTRRAVSAKFHLIGS